jgi:DNA-binding MarR family transcriptional regulator
MTGASDWPGNVTAAFALHVAGRLTAATNQASGRSTSDTVAVVALSSAILGASQDTLAAVLGITQSGAARLVNRLVEEGLLQRDEGSDWRTVALTPTEQGRRVATEVLDARATTMRQVLAPLDLDEQHQLVQLLGRVLAGMTYDSPDAIRICRMCDLSICHDLNRCPVTHAKDSRQSSTSR